MGYSSRLINPFASVAYTIDVQAVFFLIRYPCFAEDRGNMWQESNVRVVYPLLHHEW